jgi:hypothetical protein
LQALPRLRGIERNDDGDGETDTVELCIIEGDIVEARVTVQRAGLTIHAPSRERLRKVEPRVGPRSTRSRPGRPTSAGTAWHRRSEPPHLGAWRTSAFRRGSRRTWTARKGGFGGHSAEAVGDVDVDRRVDAGRGRGAGGIGRDG